MKWPKYSLKKKWRQVHDDVISQNILEKLHKLGDGLMFLLLEYKSPVAPRIRQSQIDGSLKVFEFDART